MNELTEKLRNAAAFLDCMDAAHAQACRDAADLLSKPCLWYADDGTGGSFPSIDDALADYDEIGHEVCLTPLVELPEIHVFTTEDGWKPRDEKV